MVAKTGCSDIDSDLHIIPRGDYTYLKNKSILLNFSSEQTRNPLYSCSIQIYIVHKIKPVIIPIPHNNNVTQYFKDSDTIIGSHNELLHKEGVKLQL